MKLSGNWLVGIWVQKLESVKIKSKLFKIGNRVKCWTELNTCQNILWVKNWAQKETPKKLYNLFFGIISSMP